MTITTSYTDQFTRRLPSGERSTITFTHFRAVGEPPPDRGLPGDIYVDTIKPEAHVLWGKTNDGWKRWGRARDDKGGTVEHPVCKDMILLCREPAQINWVSKKTLQHRKSLTDKNTYKLVATVVAEIDKKMKAKVKEETKRKSTESASAEPPLKRQKLPKAATSASASTPLPERATPTVTKHSSARPLSKQTSSRTSEAVSTPGPSQSTPIPPSNSQKTPSRLRVPTPNSDDPTSMFSESEMVTSTPTNAKVNGGKLPPWKKLPSFPKMALTPKKTTSISALPSAPSTAGTPIPKGTLPAYASATADVLWRRDQTASALLNKSFCLRYDDDLDLSSDDTLSPTKKPQRMCKVKSINRSVERYVPGNPLGPCQQSSTVLEKSDVGGQADSSLVAHPVENIGPSQVPESSETRQVEEGQDVGMSLPVQERSTVTEARSDDPDGDLEVDIPRPPSIRRPARRRQVVLSDSESDEEGSLPNVSESVSGSEPVRTISSPKTPPARPLIRPLARPPSLQKQPLPSASNSPLSSSSRTGKTLPSDIPATSAPQATQQAAPSCSSSSSSEPGPSPLAQSPATNSIPMLTNVLKCASVRKKRKRTASDDNETSPKRQRIEAKLRLLEKQNIYLLALARKHGLEVTLPTASEDISESERMKYSPGPEEAAKTLALERESSHSGEETILRSTPTHQKTPEPREFHPELESGSQLADEPEDPDSDSELEPEPDELDPEPEAEVSPVAEPESQAVVASKSPTTTPEPRPTHASQSRHDTSERHPTTDPEHTTSQSPHTTAVISPALTPSDPTLTTPGPHPSTSTIPTVIPAERIELELESATQPIDSIQVNPAVNSSRMELRHQISSILTEVISGEAVPSREAVSSHAVLPPALEDSDLKRQIRAILENMVRETHGQRPHLPSPPPSVSKRSATVGEGEDKSDAGQTSTIDAPAVAQTIGSGSQVVTSPAASGLLTPATTPHAAMIPGTRFTEMGREPTESSPAATVEKMPPSDSEQPAAQSQSQPQPFTGAPATTIPNIKPEPVEPMIPPPTKSTFDMLDIKVQCVYSLWMDGMILCRLCLKTNQEPVRFGVADEGKAVDHCLEKHRRQWNRLCNKRVEELRQIQTTLAFNQESKKCKSPAGN